MRPRDGKNPLLAQIRRMATLQQLRQMPDRELLAHFVGQSDEAAFRVLIDHHGSMVLRVCKRMLGNDHDAEDASQAVFLVLASKAGSPPWEESVAPWLHGVAVRVASKARRANQRRRQHEHQAMEKKTINPSADVSLRETYALLDEEIARLPEKYRRPVIECELMSRRQEEVGRLLGCSARSIRVRLEKGKKLLHKRLAARGVTLTGLMLSLLLMSENEATALPPVVAADILRGVLLFVQGQKVAGASAATIQLAGMAIKDMCVAPIRTRAIGVVLTLLLAGGGLGGWHVFTHKASSANPLANPPAAKEIPVAVDAAPTARGKVARPEVPAPIDGPMALIRGKVLDDAGRSVPLAAVTALIRRPFRPGEHGLRDEVIARGQADEQGRYRLRVPADFPTWFPERQVVLVAKAPGRAPFTTIVRLAEQGATEVDFRLTALERIAQGRLLAPDGAAARGVRLRVIRLGDVSRETVQGIAEQDGPNLGWPGPVVSDGEGCFALSGINPEQGVWLQVEDDRFAPGAFRLTGLDKQTEIHLKPAQVIEGRVIAADNGEAVAGIKLTIRLPGQFLNPGHLTVPDYQSVWARLLPPVALDGVSGAEGRFWLRSPVGAKTMLEVHPPAESPYLAVCKEVDWSQGLAQRRLAVVSPDPARPRPPDIQLPGEEIPHKAAPRKPRPKPRPVAPEVDRRKWFRLPQQFELADTSGITTTIHPGDNTFDIELK